MHLKNNSVQLTNYEIITNVKHLENALKDHHVRVGVRVVHKGPHGLPVVKMT